MQKLVIIFSFICSFGFAQTDRDVPIIDSVLPPIEMNNKWKEIPFLTFKENSNCETNNINIIDLTITPCDKINDKNLVPHKSHNWYIQPRIIDLKTTDDTLDFKIIGLSQCCAKFELYFECINDSTIGINYKDVSDEMCYCGNCPYLFEGKLFIKNNSINNILLNQKVIKRTTDRYNENVVRFVQEDSISGKKIIKTYIDNGYRYFTEQDLLLEEIIDDSSVGIQTKIYFNGQLVKE